MFSYFLTLKVNTHLLIMSTKYLYLKCSKKYSIYSTRLAAFKDTYLNITKHKNLIDLFRLI